MFSQAQCGSHEKTSLLDIAGWALARPKRDRLQEGVDLCYSLSGMATLRGGGQLCRRRRWQAVCDDVFNYVQIYQP